MNKIKRLSIIALVLLIVGTVGSILTLKPMINRRSFSEEKVINKAFSHIDISSDNTSVEVLPTTDSKAKVGISGKVGKGSKYHLSTDVKNSNLFIRARYEQRSFINLFPSSLTLKVYLPKRLYKTLKIGSDDGRIIVRNLQANDININSNDGKIELSNIKGTSVSTQADDGLSSLKNVKANAVQVNSNDGRINLDQVDGRISGKANDGTISLKTNQLDHPIELETDDGRINIQTKKKPTNATINASGQNAKVSIFKGSDSTTVFGKGEHLISLTARDGSINIEKK